MTAPSVLDLDFAINVTCLKHSSASEVRFNNGTDECSPFLLVACLDMQLPSLVAVKHISSAKGCVYMIFRGRKDDNVFASDHVGVVGCVHPHELL